MDEERNRDADAEEALARYAREAVSDWMDDMARDEDDSEPRSEPNWESDWWGSAWLQDGRPSSFEAYIAACKRAWAIWHAKAEGRTP